jgi:quercetin dioxygenase-like cupin family protein
VKKVCSSLASRTAIASAVALGLIASILGLLVPPGQRSAVFSFGKVGDSELRSEAAAGQDATVDIARTPRPTPATRTLTCLPLLSLPGKAIATVVIDFPPSAYSQARLHPGPVKVTVVAGAIRTRFGDGRIVDHEAGEGFEIPSGPMHTSAENTSPTSSATLIATLVVDQTCGSRALIP